MLKVPTSSLRNKGNSVKKISNICPFVCPSVRLSVFASCVSVTPFSTKSEVPYRPEIFIQVGFDNSFDRPAMR